MDVHTPGRWRRRRRRRCLGKTSRSTTVDLPLSEGGAVWRDSARWMAQQRQVDVLPRRQVDHPRLNVVLLQMDRP